MFWFDSKWLCVFVRAIVCSCLRTCVRTCGRLCVRRILGHGRSIAHTHWRVRVATHACMQARGRLCWLTQVFQWCRHAKSRVARIAHVAPPHPYDYTNWCHKMCSVRCNMICWCNSALPHKETRITDSRIYSIITLFFLFSGLERLNFKLKPNRWSPTMATFIRRVL